MMNQTLKTIAIINEDFSDGFEDVALDIAEKCESLRDILYMMAEATRHGDIASPFSLEFIAVQLDECNKKALTLSR